MGNIIGAVVLGAIAIICFVVSYLQFNEKGFLFNNAYIYASKQERENMDKEPNPFDTITVIQYVGQYHVPREITLRQMYNKGWWITFVNLNNICLVKKNKAKQNHLSFSLVIDKIFHNELNLNFPFYIKQQRYQAHRWTIHLHSKSQTLSKGDQSQSQTNISPT